MFGVCGVYVDDNWFKQSYRSQVRLVGSMCSIAHCRISPMCSLFDVSPFELLCLLHFWQSSLKNGNLLKLPISTQHEYYCFPLLTRTWTDPPTWFIRPTMSAGTRGGRWSGPGGASGDAPSGSQVTQFHHRHQQDSYPDNTYGERFISSFKLILLGVTLCFINQHLN